MNKFDYENDIYLDKLNDLNLSYYSKYVKFIERNLKDNTSMFLDVGCGNGTVLKLLGDKGYLNGYGIDISKLFIREGKRKGLKNLYSYDGIKLPFVANYFDVIGSFNVLEHTQNPKKFLKEEIMKLKKGGILIVACPNFTSVLFPSYHRRIKGIRNKVRNLLFIMKKLIKTDGFEMMEPLIRKNFQYDDDAIVITNLIDLRKVLVENNCNVVYESGFINYDTFIYRAINSLPLVRYLLPSCFVVARKK